MALSIAEIKIKERKHRYYLENKEEIKKKAKEADKGHSPAKALFCLIYRSRK